MKIFGIGTDIVNIKRIEKSLKRNGKALQRGTANSRRFLKKKGREESTRIQ